eukprot:g79783.t1
MAFPASRKTEKTHSYWREHIIKMPFMIAGGVGILACMWAVGVGFHTDVHASSSHHKGMEAATKDRQEISLSLSASSMEENVKHSGRGYALGTRAELSGTEFVYHLPSKDPIGIIFMAHGCNHNSLDFGRKSEKCPNCIGLPVEMSLVEMSLARNLAVVAVSAEKSPARSCWGGSSSSQAVAKVLKSFPAKYAPSLKGKPIYALGASSGGSLVSRLPLVVKLHGVCVQVAHLANQAIKQMQADYPPSIAIYMQYPSPSRHEVDQLKSLGVRAKLIESKAIALTANFFSDRAIEISPAQSASLFSALKSHQFLDKEGFLIESPRSSNWRDVLRNISHNDTLESDVSTISELLNLAASEHEITAEYMQETLDFFLMNTSQ